MNFLIARVNKEHKKILKQVQNDSFGSSLSNAAPLSGQEKCDWETPSTTTLGVKSGGRIVS
ncbi:MAG: hypothetical protein K6A15_08965, partial [Treponema sp.]|nr:hypothetical protein [Treponema sp.]